MRKTKRYVALVLLVLVALVGCSNSDGQGSSPRALDQDIRQKYSHRFFGTFDTVIDIIVYASSEDQAQEYFKYAEERFEELHKLYNGYDAYDGINNVYRINELAGVEGLEVHDDLYDLIEKSINAYHSYSDTTDISMGSLTQLWQKYQKLNSLSSEEELEGEDRLPSRADLEEARDNIGIDHIVLNPDARTIYVDDPQVIMDVGATAKGYAVELVAQELEDMGCDSAIISGGGNVRTIGSPKDGERAKWGVGIWDPDSDNSNPSQSNIIETVYVGQKSVVTSGDYQRFFIVDGVRYHHIIDKETMYPADNFRSVTVVHEDSFLADFLSTSCFVLDYERGRELIESVEGAECMWVLKDMTYEYTEGFKDMAKSFGAVND